MTRTFDRTPLLETIPSFYRNYVEGQDLDVLATIWEGITRVLDAEYAQAAQVGASNKVARARATTLYPWVREEIDWTPTGVRHQHAVMSVTSADDHNFYFGRFFDIATVRLYYEGTPVALTSQDLLTNEQDDDQRSGAALSGTRLRLEAAGPPAGTGEMVIEGHEILRHEFVGDGTTTAHDVTWYDGSDDVEAEVDQDLWSATVWYDDITSLVAVTGGATTTPSIAYPAGFLTGQSLEAERSDGSVLRHTFTSDVASVTLTASTGVAITAVRLVINLPIYPNPVELTATHVTFPTVVMPGIRVRITDAAGAQSLITTRGARSYRLERPVDPDTASVFVFGIDLTAIAASAVDIDLGRAPRAGIVILLTAPYAHDHDHAKFSTMLQADSATVTLPATRPMALTAGLAEIPRYPVSVLVNGVRLDPTQYSFISTVTIQKTSGTFGRFALIDVVYTDAEEPEQHAHDVTNIQLYAGQGVSVLELAAPTDTSRYPVWADILGSTVVHPSRFTARDAAYLPVAPALVEGGDAVVRVTGTRYRPAYTATLPSRSDQSESYVGTIVSVESIQNGVDDPTTRLLPGAGLEVTRVGDVTIVESDLNSRTCWFQNVEVDEHRISEVLGVAVGLSDSGETTEAYLDAIRSLYAAYYQGSQVDTLENFACLILGSSYTTEPGKSRGIQSSGDGRVLNVLSTSGSTELLEIDSRIPTRDVPTTVPALFAVNRHCTIVDRDLSGETFLAYFAQAISSDYAYAKRLDVRTPTTLISTPGSYDQATGVLFDPTVDFYAREVWPGDLIAFSSAGATDGTLVIEAALAYSRVVEILDAHRIRAYVTLGTDGYGWGEEFGWGEEIGWGGASISDSVASYVIWNRTTRLLDSGLHLDEMHNHAQALAHGESVQEINSILAELLRHFFFVVKIDWYAQTSQERLEYLKHFLDTAKPADVGYFAYTTVENDTGITDVLTADVADRDPTMVLLGRYLYVDQDAVGSCAVAPDLTADAMASVTFTPGWWDPTT